VNHTNYNSFLSRATHNPKKNSLSIKKGQRKKILEKISQESHQAKRKEGKKNIRINFKVINGRSRQAREEI
jgi:hypothetical protein